jgi:hypothetical protein
VASEVVDVGFEGAVPGREGLGGGVVGAGEGGETPAAEVEEELG